jgi:RNA polymerase sigma-70 factor (sigma-E family)
MADDPPGFRDFVAARSPALLRLAWMLTLDSAAAEDLLQTALARTWPHWERVAGGSPEAYVRQVMVRTAGSWRRRRWTGEVPADRLPDVASPDETAGHDERVVLTRMLAALPPGQRRVVVLRYYADLSEAEVAGLVGCSVGTVKSQAAKGLAHLRTALGAPERRPT